MLTDTQPIVDKGLRIKKTLAAMPVGSCGVKYDILTWRVSENGWIVGREGVRVDGYVHTLESAVDWFLWAKSRAAN